MGSSVRPDSTGLPPLHRVLTPEEYQQAQTLSPEALQQPGVFPLLPPVPKAQAESTRLPYLNKPDANPQARKLNDPTHVLEDVVNPMFNHPVQTALSANPIGAAIGTVMMAKDIGQYGLQKAREMQMSAEDRHIAENAPDRIPGHRAAWEAGMLAMPLVAHAIFKGVRAIGAAPDAAVPTTGTTASPGVDGLLGPVPPAEEPAVPGMERTAEESGLARQAKAERDASRQAIIRDREATRAAARNDLQASRQAVRQHMQAVQDSWKGIFQPSPEMAEAKTILRATTGASAAQYEQAAFKLDDFRRAIDPLPDQQKLDFIDAIETGNHDAIDPEFRGAAQTIRQTLDQTRDAIRNLGTGKLDHFIQDYFPHIWKDPDAARVAFEAQHEKGIQAPPTAPDVEQALGELRQQRQQTTDPTQGAELDARISTLELQQQKLGSTPSQRPPATGPAAQTRAEFEATGESLLHGTTRSFDRFDEAGAKSTRGAKPATARYYFTNKPEVARTFANNPGGFREVNLDHYANSHPDFGESYYDLDPQDQQRVLGDLRKDIQKKIDAGHLVEATDTDGNLGKITDASKLTEDDFTDGNVRVWKKGNAPRVIETKVYGPTLDLTGETKLPPDVVAELKKRGLPAELPKGQFGHEFSAELIAAARDLGYGKIVVPDVYESGFKSTIALPEYIGYGRDAHRAFVERALAEGKSVPARVLADYPDLARGGGGGQSTPSSGPPSQALPSARGKRPFEGSKSFLKERTIPTTKEGIALGLEPVSYNPVDLTLLKLREMQRYLMAHQSLNEMKGAGLVKYVPAGTMAPDGYARINDKIATVFGPREGAVSLPEGANIEPADVGVPGLRIMGEYWAPEPVANTVNNYLSPGLSANLRQAFPGPTGVALAKTFDAYRGLGNTLNQAQLGLSAFHLGFTSMDATVSRTALGLEYLSKGNVKGGLTKIASAPIAALPGIVQGLGGDLANHFLGTDFQFGLGAKIRAAYLNPDKATPEMAALANAVKEAGGRVRQDSFYRNSAPEKMIQAWRNGAYGKSVGWSLPAIFDLAARPIMEHIVPLQKLQVFGELAQKAMSEMPPDASLTERRSALQDAWDSTDNRMGQLVYDNLFWNKTFKDLAMASTRSVGWNLGTIRELGGGVKDIAGAAKDVATGSPAELSHRAAYVVALPVTIGMYGALYQYLRTGDGPQEMKDYYFPRTGQFDADGNPERVQLPSYMKDMLAYAGSPWQTLTHKVAPLPSAVVEMLNNQDFYGDEIRNPTDPFVKQVGQEAEYIGKQVVPFSLTNMREANQRGDQSAGTKIGSWFGVTPAPRSRQRTDAQNLMAEYAAQDRSIGTPPEEVRARQERATVLANLRGGNGPQLEDAVNKAIEHGSLTPPQIAKLMKRAGLLPLQERFKGLTLEQAMNVFQQADPREQALFAEILAKKIARASR